MLSVTRLLCGTTTETDGLRDGQQRRPPGDGVPLPVVVWTTTRRCNLACLHCYASAADRPFRGELSTDEAALANGLPLADQTRQKGPI